jgi:hypothetical protein
MTSRDFCYWLQGFFELRGHEDMSSEQVECVAKHLSLVFKHEIDPSQGTPEHQAELQKLHDALAKNSKRIEEVANRPAPRDWSNEPVRC